MLYVKAFITEGSTELVIVVSGINKIYAEKHYKGKRRWNFHLLYPGEYLLFLQSN